MLPQQQHVERGSGPQEPPPWLAMGPDVERNLWFLQRQHAETLQQLHAEIELLKRKNRDLHYQLIMHPELQRTESSIEVPRKLLPRTASELKAVSSSIKIVTTPVPQPSQAAATGQQQEEVMVVMEKGEELADFWRQEEHPVMGKAAKAEETSVGAKVSSVPKGAKDSLVPKGSKDSTVSRGAKESVGPKGVRGLRSVQEAVPAEAVRPRAKEFCDRASSPIHFVSPSGSTTRDLHLPIASSNPFLVNVLPSHMRKPPTLEECEVVIRQLWNINHMQMQEITYLRSCLEDIQRTKRIPEDYRLAGQLGQDSRHFHSMKNASQRCRILNPLPAAERAVLPALKQTLGNAFAERQKRTQAVQRSRLQRTAR